MLHLKMKNLWIFNSQLNMSGREPGTCDTPVSHSIDIPTEELKSIAIIGTLSFLKQYPLRLASISTKQAYRQSKQHHIHTHMNRHTDNEISEKE